MIKFNFNEGQFKKKNIKFWLFQNIVKFAM